MGRMTQKAERQAWTDFVERGLNAQASVDALCKVKSLEFIVECKAAPQGSMSGVAIVRDDGSPGTIFKSDNKRTHPYRNEVGWAALRAKAAAGLHELLLAPAGLPVRVAITFVFARPKSAPATRSRPIVKPDLDKLARSTADGLTGVLYEDDSQVVDYELHKIYGTPERVHIRVEIVEEG